LPSKAKVVGQHGSWFAKINGTSYPCVHRHWVKYGKPMIYSDPVRDPKDRHWPEFLEALRSQKKVILTQDDTPDEGTNFTRTGYIALYAIEDVVMDTTLRFRFVERLTECE
jgi:hypothetical protein